MKGILEWIGEQYYFKTGDCYSALRLEVKHGLKWIIKLTDRVINILTLLWLT